jgi:hypothetical protein
MDIGNSACHHGFRFSDLGAADAHGPVTNLQVSDNRRFVGLHMRATAAMGPSDEMLHPRKVLFELIEIDQQCGRVEFFERQSGEIGFDHVG